MKSALYIFLLIVLLNPLQSQTQKEFLSLKTRYGFDVLRRPTVNFNIIPFYSGNEWLPELYLAIEIQNDRLQFIKHEDTYQAEFQVSVVIRHDKDAFYKENWVEKITLNNFEETNSKQIYQYKLFKLNLTKDDQVGKLKPGKFECIFQLHDFSSENDYKSERKFEIGENKPNVIPVSPINFVKIDDNSGYSLPFVASSNALLYNEQYAAYASVFLDSIHDIRINTRIYKEDDEDGQLFYQKYFTLSGDSNVADLKFDLPSDSMSPGKYSIQFSGFSGQNELIAEKDFEIFWFDKSTYLYKADLAFRCMRYLLTEQKFDSVNGLSYDEKEKWMDKYWAEKDPTPHTDYNELMVVYFQRVQDANEKFGLRNKEGWETDQGKILLLYGEPDKIENRIYTVNQKPHLVWIYTKYNLTFLFVDKDRDGEFTLVTEE